MKIVSTLLFLKTGLINKVVFTLRLIYIGVSILGRYMYVFGVRGWVGDTVKIYDIYLLLSHESL